MSLSSLLNCTVTRTSPTDTGVNEYGEIIIVQSSSLAFNAALQLNSGSEEVQVGGKVIVSEYVLYCLPTVDINESDKVSYNSIDYRVILADDECFRNHHKKIFLKRIP